MNAVKVARQRLVITVAAALSLIVASSVVRAADTPDGWITMKAKIALMTADNVSTSDLNVDTVNGVVTLHGKVPTEAEKTRAGEVTMKVGGVKSVKNLLQVVPNSARNVVDRADSEIKDAVEAAFKANKRVNDSGIGVASVNKGVVLLSGKTKSLDAHLEAIQVAHAVRGVRRVSSEVQVDMPSPTTF